MTAPLLEVRAVAKAFPGVQALDGVSLTLGAGEVVAVVGENGAGKSTLMKIVAGVYTPDTGEVRLNGQVVHFEGVRDALAAGISLIHQELNLAENLTVADNLFLGREPTWFGGLLDRGRMRREGIRLLERVGLPPERIHARVGDLSPGEKQLVEIARSLGLEARVLIMDEPTSSLTQKETDRLYTVIDQLKALGVGLLYISHRLAEVQRCADRVVVLRDGKNAGELDRDAFDHDTMVRLMVGRELQNIYPRAEHRGGNHAVVLELRGVQYAGGRENPVHLEIRAGEILGMAGLVGAGRTELAEAVFGIRRVLAGEVVLAGRALTIRHPRQAIMEGILLVPEDRRLHGLILEGSIRFNLGLPNLDLLETMRLVALRREHQLAQQLSERLRVRTPSVAQTVGLLSGGNQQKVVLGKWLARTPRVLILDEPTRGVDVGARSEIYALMQELANQGVAVWMISSDLEEILGMSDRVVVLHEGRVAGELGRAELSEEAVMHLATGGAQA